MTTFDQPWKKKNFPFASLKQTLNVWPSSVCIRTFVGALSVPHKLSFLDCLFHQVIPSDDACKLWGMDKTPTNVLIQTEDGRTFNVRLSEAKGKLFFLHGRSNVAIHLRLTKGCLVIFNPVDFTTFKQTYFLDCVNRSSFWTYLVSTTSHFNIF
ncbi:hypothetical protein HanRHA438_Chr10g0479561 [Helianthus annuus]|nr:putative DNA-binding pseudobarrel domain superfamily [Helianthus annuus]KAJ0531802.1 putative DNA-binding pseudobarrel domain superfamily [Helianthus annuus]KAJ0698679.1 putative DNA-binding pseudobarrel domain superfamily [Helianthus annuus]KAJ0881932.1 hypothetical protein HanRHA438_Chr10g0479561 [Helianthus annuus]